MLENDTNIAISDVIVDWLVRMYAKGGTPPLKWHMVSLSAVAKTKRYKTMSGMHVDWNVVNAFYSSDGYALVVNSDVSGDIKRKVHDVLHEIQHYNQQIKWDSSMSFRDKITKGRKLPPSVKDDSLYLYEMSWSEMIKFWEQKYGYNKAPHELDAQKFADRYVGEAVAFIEENFKD